MSTVMKQKEAVFAFVSEVVGDFSGKVSLTKEQRESVIAMLVAGFANGSIVLKREQGDAAKYADSLLSNWLRKDTRLNGGTPHQTKNPGSRAGSQDPTIRELRNLRKTLSDEAQIEKVEDAIASRLTTLKASKRKPIEVDAASLPDSLKHLVSTNA